MLTTEELLNTLDPFAKVAFQTAVKDNAAQWKLLSPTPKAQCEGALDVYWMAWCGHQHIAVTTRLFDVKILTRYTGNISLNDRYAGELFEPAWQIVDICLTNRDFVSQPYDYSNEELAALKKIAPIPFTTSAITGTVEVVRNQNSDFTIKVNPFIFEGETSMAAYHFRSLWTYRMAQELAAYKAKMSRLQVEHDALNLRLQHELDALKASESRKA